MADQVGQRPRITVRRTVPFDLTGGDVPLRLTINDMRTDPDRVVLAVTGVDVAERTTATQGEQVVLGGTPWVVEQITLGDRGSVVLVGATS